MEEIKQVLDAASVKMQKSIDHLNDALMAVRAGRASTNVLNSVMVDYYGSQMGVSAVASVTVPDARTILIQPWEKAMIAPIEKAIMIANLGMTPSNNGEQIRLMVPALTEERRKDLVKTVRADAETARVSIRNARREAVDAFKKAQKDGLPEDAAKDGEAQAQKLTDKFMKVVEDVIAAKEQDIMTV
ncbi:MAG: ribosome recycling factor [Rikenellaceae bacterium]